MRKDRIKVFIHGFLTVDYCPQYRQLGSLATSWFEVLWRISQLPSCYLLYHQLRHASSGPGSYGVVWLICNLLLNPWQYCGIICLERWVVFVAEQWQSLADACQTLKISERTLYRRIKQGEIKSKTEDSRRLVLIDLPDGRVLSDKLADSSDTILLQQVQSENELLKDEIQQKNTQIENFQQQIDETNKTQAEASQRHDTIVLQLTRQIEQAQRLLEYHQEPFYRRWFRKIGKHAE